MLHRFVVRLLGLFQRSARDRELDEELRAHIDRAIGQNLARGLTEAQARDAAVRQFGNLTSVAEEARASWQWSWVEQIRQDVRYSLRSLRRRPAFAAVAIGSIALGLGAAVTLFAVLESTLLRRLPVRNPEQLVSSHGGSYPMFKRFQELHSVFQDVAVVSPLDRSNVTIDGKSVDQGLVRVALVSGNYFPMLGVRAAVGRMLSPDDDRAPGGHPMAVLSSAYWRRRYGGTPDVVGHTLGLNGTTYTIIGVAAPDFTGDATGRPVDVWFPAMMQSQVMLELPGLLERNNGWLRIIGRMRPGLTVPQAQAAIQAAYQANEIAFAGSAATPQFIENLREDPFLLVPIEHGYSRSRDEVARALGILVAIVGSVLLIACANVAGLQLARTDARAREMAIRLAIGAGRGRLVRQLLTESVILGVIGGALGMALAVGGTLLLSQTTSVGPVQMDARAESSFVSLSVLPQWPTYLLGAALSLIVGVLFGLAPAVRGAGSSLASALIGRGGSSSVGPRRAVLGRMFVVSQVALTLVLVIVTSLFVRSLAKLQSQPLGVDRSHLLLIWTTPGQTGRSGERVPEFVHTVLESVSRIPGVISANATNHGVLEGEDEGMVSELLTVEGLASRPGLKLMRDGVTPGFFETVGMPIIQGRALDERDVAATPKVAVVNETLSRFFFGEKGGVGRRIGTGEAQVEIVGVVKDTKHGTPRDRRGIWYVSYRQYPNLLRNMCIAVRTSGDPRAVASTVRRVLHELDPQLPILRVDTIDEQLNDVLAQERTIATLSVGLGAFALLLAGIGLYGVIANGVVRRTNEIGVRMALGAQRGAVVGMVLYDTARIVIVGLLLGTPLAVVAGSLIASRLYEVKPSDPVTLVVAIVTLTLVTLMAGWLPAYRAARIDPNVALRYE